MKRFVSIFAFALMALALQACAEKEYTATAILAVQTGMPGTGGVDAPAPEHEIRKQAALLSSLSTIRKVVEGKRFHHLVAYQGNSVEQVARQLLPRVKARILPETNLIRLTCVHSDPDLVHRVVNSIAEVVIDEQVGAARSALQLPMANLLNERLVIVAEIDRLAERARSILPELSTGREMGVEFDRLRQSLLTYSGKLDELSLSMAAAAPLAGAVAAAVAEGGSGLSSLYQHPELTRLVEVRNFTVEFNTASAELEALQEYLAPEHPQVQDAMFRYRDLEARLRGFRDSWLLGRKADFDAMVALREQVQKMREGVAGEIRKLSETMTARDELLKKKLAFEQRLVLVEHRIEELGEQERRVRAHIAVIEPAARPRNAD